MFIKVNFVLCTAMLVVFTGYCTLEMFAASVSPEYICRCGRFGLQVSAKTPFQGGGHAVCLHAVISFLC